MDKAGYILFHHDRGSPARREQGRGGQTRQLRQRDSCQTPKNWREEKRRDVAAHSNRSLDINHIDAQRHCMHQPHRFTGTTNGDKTTTKAINRLRRFNDLIQPLKSIRFWFFGYNSNATKVKLDSHPPNGCEAGDERASVRLPMNAHHTKQPKSRQ